MSFSNSYLVFTFCGLVFGLFALPLTYKATKAFVSPYPKANLKRRRLASCIDAALCLLLMGLLLFPTGLTTAITLCPLYLLVKDGLFPGQSIGKLLFGLVVVQLDNGAPCRFWKSIYRNILFLIPGLNLTAIVFEVFILHRDSQGMRLGDRLARTQVIEGKKAEEWIQFIKSIIENLTGREKVESLSQKHLKTK